MANHNMRAAVSAMRQVSKAIRESESLVAVEEEITPVREVFSLTGQAELAAAEARYLAAGGGQRAILLAASRGEKLGPLTERRPKCMIDVRGEPLLQRLVRTLNESGLRDVTVVRGYRKEAIDLAGIEAVDNDRYDETGEAASLACAYNRLYGPCLVSYGDILFRRHVLEGLLAADGDIVTVVDARRLPDSSRAPDRAVDWVRCSRPFTGGYLDDDRVTLEAIGSDAAGADGAHGEFIGLVKLSEDGAALVRGALDALTKDGILDRADLPDVLAHIVRQGVAIDVHYVTGHWLDVDDAFDLAAFATWLASQTPLSPHLPLFQLLPLAPFHRPVSLHNTRAFASPLYTNAFKQPPSTPLCLPLQAFPILHSIITALTSAEPACVQ